MNTLILRLLPLAVLLAAPGIAASQDNGNDDGDDLGVTMSVVEDQGDAAGEEGFFNEIELPDIAPEEAHSNAEGGIDTANEARDNRDHEARDQGRDVGGERPEEGRDRGDAGRGIGNEARGNAGPP